MTVAEAIRRARTAEGLSQRSLAILAGCSENYVYYLEAGRRFPSHDILKRFADVFQRDLGVIYRHKDKVIEAEFLAVVTRLRTFDELIADKKLQDRLLKDCLKMCNYDREKAKDLQQDATTTALIYQHRYNQRDQLYSWVYAVARNIRLQNLKGLRKMEFVENYIESGEISEPAGEEVPTQVYNFVNRLSEKRKRHYAMRMLGYTHRQIAEELNTTEAYSKAIFGQVKEKLEYLIKN